MKEIGGAPQWILPGWLTQHWKPALLALALSPCVAVLVVRDPADSGLFPPCPFLALTGLQCPGCGALRGLHQLLNGQLLAAVELNIVMVLALPFLTYTFLSTLARDVNAQRLPTVFVRPAWIWLLLGGIILFWVLRNLPVYPFSWFAA